MIKCVFRTSVLRQFAYGGAVSRDLSTSASLLSFYEGNKSGVPREPPEYTLKEYYEFWRNGMKRMPGEISKFKEEVKWKFRCDNLAMIEHNDYEVVWKFDNKEVFDGWVVSTDRDSNAGNSTGEFVCADNNHGLFRGHIDTTLPKDGITKRTGFCNVRSPPNFISFSRVRPYDWELYTHLVMRVRGDGRPYTIVLRMHRQYDVQWLDVYNYVLFTRGGPYWQVAKIPFSKFFLSSSGRIQDKQGEIQLGHISTFGLTLMDGASGPFQLEIDYIALQFDARHTHKFEYELYPSKITAAY